MWNTIKLLTFYIALWFIFSPSQAWPHESTNHSLTKSRLSAAERSTSQKHFLQSPTDLKVIELPSLALTFWRSISEQQPTLVILSTDPFLMAIPDELDQQVKTLVKQGSPIDFQTRARKQVVSPLIMPQQTLAAAIKSGLFGKILWVLPPEEKEDVITLEIFRQEVTETGILSTEEAKELSFEKGVFRGIVQGVPFQATTINTLPQLEGPVVLHLDLNFFAAQYRNEITTPLLSLLQNSLLSLRQTNWEVVLATLSTSTEEGDVPLEMRFLKDVLAEIFARPGRLDSPLPETWALRKEARYLETFLQPESMLKNYLQMEALLPKEASVKYEIYRTLMMLKEDDEAFDYLSKAVQLDKEYGREYINLGMKASAQGEFKEALQYLRKGRKALPLNPFVTIETVNILLDLGERQQARVLLTELGKASWSPVYYPELPKIIRDLSLQAKGQK